MQRQQETLPVSGATTSAAITYGYDALGRVTSRTVAGSGPETFQYDAIGRLVTHGSDLGSFTLAYLGRTNQITGLTQSSDATLAITAAASQTATFNALNQISTLNGQSVSYNANGNLTSDGTLTYTWDAETA